MNLYSHYNARYVTRYRPNTQAAIDRRLSLCDRRTEKARIDLHATQAAVTQARLSLRLSLYGLAVSIALLLTQL